jgi:deazaflavin-dependent oxidoreductase (nitroreductase family)
MIQGLQAQGAKNGRNISGMCKTRRENCPKKGSSTLFLCDDHMWWSSRQSLSSEKRKETMAKIDKAPMYVRVANVLTLTLLRVGFKLVGPGLVIGNYPMYLLTVRGRKSGQPRTVAVAIIQRNGKRYVGSPYGIVAWVRNLRAAGEATLTRGRRSETVNARELPKGEAALVLREEVKDGNPFVRSYGVTADSSLEEFERAAVSHPLFVLERK